MFERLDDLFENKFQQTNIISLSRFRMTKSNFCSYAIFINHAKQQKEIKETGAINLVTTFWGFASFLAGVGEIDPEIIYWKKNAPIMLKLVTKFFPRFVISTDTLPGESSFVKKKKKRRSKSCLTHKLLYFETYVSIYEFSNDKNYRKKLLSS